MPKSLINNLINNLKNDVYCRIKSSKNRGVGVFAIKDIPANTNPFIQTNKICDNQRILYINEEVINKLDPEVKKMVHDFYHKENGVYGISYRGLNGNTISSYLNTSKKPNVGLKYDNKCSFLIFITKRKIKKGEELFINYEEYN